MAGTHKGSKTIDSPDNSTPGVIRGRKTRGLMREWRKR
jgi:hypothetical protein